MKRVNRSYPPTTRDRARLLRQQGYTYTEIIEALGGGIPKNTISVWVRDIELTETQKARIRQIELEARARGRPLAAAWHREQKRQRIEAAEAWAEPIAERIVQNRDALLIMLAALWAGEGEKKDDLLSFANSDPSIIQAWVFGLRTAFDLDESKFRVQLLISDGMEDTELKNYWSQVVQISLAQFHKTTIDTRPKKVTRKGYKGVCRVIYFSAEIRRQLGSLAYRVFDKLFNSG